MKQTTRYQLVDVLRGLAIVLMVGYHLCFDLNYFGLLHLDMYRDPAWIALRSLIVTLFLFLVGVSLHLAGVTGRGRSAYLHRLGLLLGCAVLVSIASYQLFPHSWIFFGVLHFIAVASVLGLAMRGRGTLNLVLGVALVAIGASLSHPLFNQPALQWIGLMTHKPITEDYVPLLPWFGVVLLGMWSAQRLLRDGPPRWLQRHYRAWPLPALALGGRHGLAIYMLHQPLLLGILWLLLPSPA